MDVIAADAGHFAGGRRADQSFPYLLLSRRHCTGLPTLPLPLLWPGSKCENCTINLGYSLDTMGTSLGSDLNFSLSSQPYGWRGYVTFSKFWHEIKVGSLMLIGAFVGKYEMSFLSPGSVQLLLARAETIRLNHGRGRQFLYWHDVYCRSYGFLHHQTIVLIMNPGMVDVFNCL